MLLAVVVLLGAVAVLAAGLGCLRSDSPREAAAALDPAPLVLGLAGAGLAGVAMFVNYDGFSSLWSELAEGVSAEFVVEPVIPGSGHPRRPGAAGRAAAGRRRPAARGRYGGVAALPRGDRRGVAGDRRGGRRPRGRLHRGARRPADRRRRRVGPAGGPRRRSLSRAEARHRGGREHGRRLDVPELRSGDPGVGGPGSAARDEPRPTGLQEVQVRRSAAPDVVIGVHGRQ